jgi:nitrogen regulatory protein P-II 2
MKLAIAFAKPFKPPAITDALTAAGVTGISVSKIRGFGRQRGQTEIYRGAQCQARFLPRIRIEVLTDNNHAPATMTAVTQAAHAVRIRAGKTAVPPETTPSGFAPANAANTPYERARRRGTCSGHIDRYPRREERWPLPFDRRNHRGRLQPVEELPVHRQPVVSADIWPATARDLGNHAA